MKVSVLSQSEKTPSTISSNLVKWREYHFEDVTLQGSIIDEVVTNKQLKGTLLSCTIETEAGKWQNRQAFIEKVLANIFSRCPKDEPLVLISLGSDRLLIEYILGKSLLENGFQQLSFILIDPIYALSDPSELRITLNVLADFRKHIEQVYLASYQEGLAKERIRFLSRGQNVAKCFPQHANVALIECLPSYAECLKDIVKHWNKEKANIVKYEPDQKKAAELIANLPYKVKKTEDLLAGGCIVSPKHANALALMPRQYAEQLQKAGAKFKETSSLPVAIFQFAASYFYLDWGCKIESDGSYHLSFNGEESYFASLGLSSDQEIKVGKDEVVRVKEWIPTIKKRIEELLQREIKQIEPNQANLSQEQISSLLIKVQEVALLYMPGIQSYFTADYALDRKELLTTIKSQASQHYRRAFSLSADTYTTYKITIDGI